MAVQSEKHLWIVARRDGAIACQPFQRWCRFRTRPITLFFAAALAVASGHTVDRAATAPGADAAVAGALRSRGLSCDAQDVVWIDAPRGIWSALRGGARAIVRASHEGEPTDLYLVDARLSPEGTVLEVGNAHNVTETSGVDESRPMIHGRTAVYTTAADGLVTGVHVFDLGGPAASSYADFSRMQRVQVSLTNLQQTGRTSGLVHTTFALDPIARRCTVAWPGNGNIEVRADDHVVVLDPDRARVVAGQSFVRVVTDEPARPGNILTWAVDRVRAMPWFGDDKMQWAKAIAFTALDGLRSTLSHNTTMEDVRSELGISPVAPLDMPAFTDPEIGWPPSPIPPIVSPSLPGEGQWIGLDKDPFITQTPGGTAAAFVTSFIRPDVHRQDVRVYATLWDPRQVALHIEAGTVEPISATGEHGPGRIPRDPRVMRRLVAAFNGGFQAQHGEYGMLANGIEYLPPKPYAATVVELRDGSNGFGVWPNSAALPENVVALRQNLTALVQGDAFNPWGRTWWGGAPPGWPDQVHSTRSAICLTKEGFVGYFYSTNISAEDLARGMLAARCSFGIHLDMNPGHAGFEFYSVAPERLTALGRRLQPDWEAEGKVSDMGQYVFRSRRMIRGMGHMLFPRYIQREARDFFYLTLRPSLPGAPIPTARRGRDPDGTGEEGAWRTKGLPQHGFPYALATTSASGGEPGSEIKFYVVRADPRALAPADRGSGDAPTVLALVGPGRGSLTLWWAPGRFAVAPTPPTSEAVPLAGGDRLGDQSAAGRTTSARAALGVDDDGMLAWVELPAEVEASLSTARAMDELLERLGCATRMFLTGDARALLGGTLDAAGHPMEKSPAPVARLVRTRTPDAHEINTDTPIVPIQVWQPLQAKRVRYFLKPSTQEANTTSRSQALPPGPRRTADTLAPQPGER
jgi:hypothetical protein